MSWEEQVRLLTLVRWEAKKERVSEIPYRHKEKLFYLTTSIWNEDALSPSLEIIKIPPKTHASWSSQNHIEDAGLDDLQTSLLNNFVTLPSTPLAPHFCNAAVFCLNLRGEPHQDDIRVPIPADIAIVVPATIPMVTPFPLGGGIGAGYMVAGMPLGCTTVVWWITWGGAAYKGCV